MTAFQVMCNGLWVMGKNKKNSSLITHHSSPKKGFTLIELLVAISIIAVISAIGFISYSTAQLTGRDARRKQDLNSISVALQLYYQVVKTYPPTTVLINSVNSPTWTGLVTYGGTYFINTMPVDPVNTVGPPVRAYTYTSDAAGSFYILCANLENASDPSANPGTCTEISSSTGNYKITNP